ncbi:MAG: aldehyde dehydrogenase family protein, partial [Candidatus Sumerlaeota bacterium]|nr:aldehyde dehydrogenase family protein [Candidatus Sumerlaeota bacterium]
MLHRLFQASGYETAAFGKRHLTQNDTTGWDHNATISPPKMDPSQENYDEWIEKQGMLEAYRREEKSEMKSPVFTYVSQLKSEQTPTAYVAAKTVEFLTAKRDPAKPFFCWCSFLSPHQPYTPPAKWAAKYDPNKITLPASAHQPPDQLPPYLKMIRLRETGGWALGQAAKDERLYREFLAHYYALVSQNDYYYGQVLDALERQGLADNAVVIYTADHGDFACAHGLVEKQVVGHNVYEDTLRIPLLARFPGHFRRGAACDDIDTLRYFAEISQEIPYDEPLRPRGAGLESRRRLQPYGVCAFIFPWNFPLGLLAWGIAPALAAGNTVVVKPAEDTPLSSLYFCTLLEVAGVPRGVVNVISGDGPTTGAALAAHPGIARMSFTGSSEVGVMVNVACARNLVPAKLELGGKGAAVVFEDVEIPQVAQALCDAITVHAGQICCTATRGLIQERIWDSFVAEAKAILESMPIG